MAKGPTINLEEINNSLREAAGRSFSDSDAINPYTVDSSAANTTYDSYWGGKDSTYHDRSKSNLEDVFYDLFTNNNQKRIDHKKDMDNQIEQMKAMNWGPANGESYTYDDFENYQNFMDSYDSSRSNDKGLGFISNAYDNLVDSVRSNEAGVQDNLDILQRIGGAGYDMSGFAGDIATTDKLINASANAAAEQGNSWSQLSDDQKNQIIENVLTTYATEGIDATGGKSGRNNNLINGEYNAQNGDYNNAAGQLSTYLTLAPDVLLTAVPGVAGVRGAAAAGKLASNAVKAADAVSTAEKAAQTATKASKAADAAHKANVSANNANAVAQAAKSGGKAVVNAKGAKAKNAANAARQAANNTPNIATTAARAEEAATKMRDAKKAARTAKASQKTADELVQNNDILQSRLGNAIANRLIKGYDTVDTGVTGSNGFKGAVNNLSQRILYPAKSGARDVDVAASSANKLLPKNTLKRGIPAVANVANWTWTGNESSKTNDRGKQNNTGYNTTIAAAANLLDDDDLWV